MELESGIEVEAYGSKADSGESRNAEVYIQKQSERLARSDYTLQVTRGFPCDCGSGENCLSSDAHQFAEVNGNYAEQFAKVFHKATPNLRRDPKAVEQ